MDTRRLVPVNKETDITRNKIKFLFEAGISIWSKKKKEKQKGKQGKTGTKIIFANGFIDRYDIYIYISIIKNPGHGGGFARHESVWSASGASSAWLKFEGQTWRVAQSVFSTEFSSPVPPESFTNQYNAQLATPRSFLCNPVFLLSQVLAWKTKLANEWRQTRGAKWVAGTPSSAFKPTRRGTTGLGSPSRQLRSNRLSPRVCHTRQPINYEHAIRHTSFETGVILSRGSFHFASLEFLSSRSRYIIHLRERF